MEYTQGFKSKVLRYLFQAKCKRFGRLTKTSKKFNVPKETIYNWLRERGLNNNPKSVKVKGGF